MPMGLIVKEGVKRPLKKVYEGCLIITIVFSPNGVLVERGNSIHSYNICSHCFEREH
jgi:hypothetical protein